MTIISSEPNIYKSWNRLLISLGKHCGKSGFHLQWWENDKLIGFRCQISENVWAMDRQEILAQEKVIASAYKSKKAQEKFLASLQILLAASVERDESKEKCKAEDCDRAAAKEGFCGWCLNKVKKGQMDKTGKRILTLEEKKLDLSKKITMEKLKLYQVEFPESKKTFHCKKVGIFIEEASCYHRMLVKDKKECRGCKVHEKRIDVFAEFLNREQVSNG